MDIKNRKDNYEKISKLWLCRYDTRRNFSKEKDEADDLIQQKERITANEKKIADKASGNQKLKDLGLTDDEIAALVS